MWSSLALLRSFSKANTAKTQGQTLTHGASFNRWEWSRDHALQLSRDGTDVDVSPRDRLRKHFRA